MPAWSSGCGLVLPTMLVWSVVSLKEILVLFVALLALRMVQFLTTAPARSNRLTDALVPYNQAGELAAASIALIPTIISFSRVTCAAIATAKPVGQFGFARHFQNGSLRWSRSLGICFMTASSAVGG